MQDGLVRPDEKRIERIGLFAPEFAAHQIEHQYGNECHRQDGGEGHGVGLGEGERREEAIAFPRQRKDRQEGDGDDEEREEDAGADFLSRFDQGGTALCRAGFAFQFRQFPAGVFDKHDGGIHHRADGDGDAAQRHDVRGHPLKRHDEERTQHPQGKRDDRHQRRAHMQEENQDDERNCNAFLDQFVFQVLDRAFDQGRAVIDRDDLDALG